MINVKLLSVFSAMSSSISFSKTTMPPESEMPIAFIKTFNSTRAPQVTIDSLCKGKVKICGHVSSN